MKVYQRPECVYNYCPNPDMCKEDGKCRHPKQEDKK